jgi:hypothetical protein
MSADRTSPETKRTKPDERVERLESREIDEADLEKISGGDVTRQTENDSPGSKF